MNPVADKTSPGMPGAADAASDAPSAEFLSLVPQEFARRHLVLSRGRVDGREQLAVAGTTCVTAAHNVGVRLGVPVVRHETDAEQLAAAIDRAYDQAAASSPKADEPAVVHVEGSHDLAADLAQAVRVAEADLLTTAGKGPVVRLVDLVLFEALQRGASDVHVQPLRDRTLVLYRLDGALHTARELPASLASAVVSRVKVMARLDVAERRAPQDGRAGVTIGAGGGGTGGTAQGSRRIDLRVSTLPTAFGERLVIRLLDPTRSPHLSSFAALGMPPEIERTYLAQAARTSGIVLSTGPTGSGKTTTLYATLNWISSTNAGEHAAASDRRCELNIMTIEDPIEYELCAPRGDARPLAVSQTQVDPKKNVTFAAGLRHILRQDPDVIMVGEIRDSDTARIAMQASLTGHLVLSTLHTNDAPSAVARLIDLGVEPFLVSSSLSAVLAQRLVRTVHRECHGRGCPECLGTGFKGRSGVFELLVVDDDIRAVINRRESADRIKAAAVVAGMVPLRDVGVALIRAGVTSASEVARVIEAVGEDEVPT